MNETQPIDGFFPSDSQEKEERHPWGRLIPLTCHKNAKHFELFDESHTIGRAGVCDFVLEDPGVSGRHCIIRREVRGPKSNDYMVWIEDLSTNGTYLNTEIVGKGNKKWLQNGFTVHFLYKGKDKEANISYLFQDCHKDEAEKHEHGGPHEQYELSEILGQGNFAQVKHAIHKQTGESYAIKIVEKKKFQMLNATKRKDTLMDEVLILSKLQHPNIIGIKEMFETDTTLYLVLELVSGGELFDKIVDDGPIPENKARNYFKQMLDASKYLHDQGIAHRDLKPENILFKDNTYEVIKLSDFGLSRVVDQASFMKTICGTPQYVAPEILQASSTSEGYGVACDLWSLGVILFVMLSGYPPFNETKPKPIFQQIKMADFDFPTEYWKDISDSAKILIRKLLNPDPRKRITAEEALNSPWIKGEKTDPLITLQPPPPHGEANSEDSESGDDESGEDEGESAISRKRRRSTPEKNSTTTTNKRSK